MFNKMLLATATAGLIAAGTMTTASAAPYGPGPGPGPGPWPSAPYGPGPGPGPAAPGPSMQFGGPGWSFQFGPALPPPPPVCYPVTKKVKWWDRYGYPHWRTITVRECSPPPPPPPPPPPYHHDYRPYGPSWGPGW